jgi:murein DD-endopeptidase MepM/ murein hydrolase activator NlpD
MIRPRGRILAATTVLATVGCGLPRWPVEGPLIAPFGVRWESGGPAIHRGVDLVAPTGTPVYAMSNGNVRFAGTMDDFGLVVWVDHGDEILTIYAHLSEILVDEGQSVTRDEPLGLSGETGNATGPHLHFEIRGRGRQVDPVAMLGGPPGP